MARTTFSVNVEPDREAVIIRNYEAFGWEVMSSQRIFNEHQEYKGDYTIGNTVYQNFETKKTDFVKITFSREKDYPNKDVLLPLEIEYNEIQKNLENMSSPSYPAKWGSNLIGLLLCFCGGFPGFAYFIVKASKNKGYRKRVKQYEEQWKARDERRSKYFDRQRQLVKIAQEYSA